MRHTLHRAVLLVAILPTLALTGCMALLDSLLGTNSSTPASVTGNWSFAANPGSGTPALPALIGALATQGSTVTGVFHGAGCISASQDIAFTGNESSSGTLTLTSTNLPNNVATITATVATVAGITTASGSLAITGSGSCASPSTSLIGGLFQPYTGTYTGTLTSSSKVAATVSATLTQANANSDGNFPETGTITLATTTCTDTFNVTGLILGPTLTATFASQAGTPVATGSATAILTPTASTLDLTSGLTVASSSCNAGTYSGTLTQK